MDRHQDISAKAQHSVKPTWPLLGGLAFLLGAGVILWARYGSIVFLDALTGIMNCF